MAMRFWPIPSRSRPESARSRCGDRCPVRVVRPEGSLLLHRERRSEGRAYACLGCRLRPAFGAPIGNIGAAPKAGPAQVA